MLSFSPPSGTKLKQAEGKKEEAAREKGERAQAQQQQEAEGNSLSHARDARALLTQALLPSSSRRNPNPKRQKLSRL